MAPYVQQTETNVKHGSCMLDAERPDSPYAFKWIIWFFTLPLQNTTSQYTSHPYPRTEDHVELLPIPSLSYFFQGQHEWAAVQ